MPSHPPLIINLKERSIFIIEYLVLNNQCSKNPSVRRRLYDWRACSLKIWSVRVSYYFGGRLYGKLMQMYDDIRWNLQDIRHIFAYRKQFGATLTFPAGLQLAKHVLNRALWLVHQLKSRVLYDRRRIRDGPMKCFVASVPWRAAF